MKVNLPKKGIIKRQLTELQKHPLSTPRKTTQQKEINKSTPKPSYFSKNLIRSIYVRHLLTGKYLSGYDNIKKRSPLKHFSKKIIVIKMDSEHPNRKKQHYENYMLFFN